MPDPADRAAVDLVLSDPEELLSTIAGGLSRRIVSKHTLPNLDRLGDASAGVSMTYLVKERFYYATVFASPDCYVSADADRFLYSFQLLTP